jgi:hypothetical protein
VSNALIIFRLPSATTPFEATNDEHFNQRAQIAIALRSKPSISGRLVGWGNIRQCPSQ